jgi:actin-related protein 6
MSAPPPVRRLVIDNGGYWLRAALVDDRGELLAPPHATLNCIGTSPVYGKGLVGSALTKLQDYHSLMLRRPVDRGYVVDVGLQAHIWRCMFEDMKITDECTIDLLLTIPFGAPDAVLENIKELVFDHFGFQSLTLVSAPFLVLVARAAAAEEAGVSPAAAPAASRKRGRAEDAQPAAAASSSVPKGTGLVVDCGFSGTTVVPYIDFRPLPESILRTDVGGKLLTNRLKEVISFLHLNMLEDQWLVNHLKETLCYVAADFRAELRKLQSDRRRGAQRYALPTIPPLMPMGSTWEKLPGDVNVVKDRDRLQVISLRQELCAVPETVFSPIDGNVPQLPLHVLIAASLRREGTMLQQCTFLHPPMVRNIIVFGGTSKLAGFTSRLEADVRAISHSEVQVRPACVPLPSSRAAKSTELALAGAESLEPIAGALYLWRHSKLLGLVEERSRVSRADALSTAPGEKPGSTKGCCLLQRAAQLLL